MPKHVVISWMAILNRLLTRDRLRNWRIEMEGKSKLWYNAMESRNHLFFGCLFSQGVWKEVLRMCGLNRKVLGWEQELEWVMRRLKVRP